MTAPSLLDAFRELHRRGEKITMLTAYDAQTAALLEAAGVPILLVGDSLGMVFQGKGSTESVTLSEMAYHGEAVVRGAPGTPVIIDLPAGTYRTSDEALAASRLLMATGASGVKLEGWFPGLVAQLTQNGIPVMGHLGLLPQTAKEFKVQGKDPLQAQEIFQAALALEKEGCFSIVLECVPESLGERVTKALGIPVIGIGAGAHTSGQVLVINDLLGYSQNRRAKFVPTGYPNLAAALVELVRAFRSDVASGRYPSDKESYH